MIFDFDLTGAADTGDLTLACQFGFMMDVLDIRLNGTELNDGEAEAIKQQCAMKTVQGAVVSTKRNQDPKIPVVCTVARQGRIGNLKATYQCLRAPQKAFRDHERTNDSRKGPMGSKKRQGLNKSITPGLSSREVKPTSIKGSQTEFINNS